jgi:O-antigen biosynthesis alpha-1,2-mannosyltransferase
VRGALSSGALVAVTPLSIFDDVTAATYALPGLDARAIANGLETLFADPALRHKLQAQATEWANDYAFPRMAERLAGILAGLVATSAVPGGPLRMAKIDDLMTAHCGRDS